MTTFHVNPLASDGQTTIGYDDNGLAGEWSGNMTEETSSAYWTTHRNGYTFCDGNENYIATDLDGIVVWTDESGNWEDIRHVIARYNRHRMTLDFVEIAAQAGFIAGPGGKLNLPATQQTADLLEEAVIGLIGPWRPGEPVLEITLTGPGPVWGYLCIAHALHGRCARLIYAAPNAPAITIFSHGL